MFVYPLCIGVYIKVDVNYAVIVLKLTWKIL